MPAIRIFGRRSKWGGDDLQPVATLTWIARTVQILFFITPCLVHVFKQAHRITWTNYFLYPPSISEECRNAHYFSSYFLAYILLSLVNATVSVGLEILLWKRSSIGSPTEPELRHPSVMHLLEFKFLPMLIFNFVVCGVGIVTTYFSKLYFTCEITSRENQNIDGALHVSDSSVSFPVWWYCYLIMLTSQCTEFILSCRTIISLLRLPREEGFLDMTGVDNKKNDGADVNLTEVRRQILIRRSLSSEDLHHLSRYGPVEDMWKERCKFFCKITGACTCYVFGGKEASRGDFSNVARVLADFLEDNGVLDLVSSDVATAFMMLRRVQQQRKLELQKAMKQHLNDIIPSKEAEKISTRVGISKYFKGNICQVASKNKGINSARSYEALVSEYELPEGNSRSIAEDTEDSFYSTVTARDENFHSSFEVDNSPLFQSDRFYFVGGTNKFPITHLNPPKLLSADTEFDCYAIEEGARFSRHALAIYTWFLYVYMNPVSGPCKLSCMRCSHFDESCCWSGNSFESTYDESGTRLPTILNKRQIIGETCCRLHESALLKHAGLDRSDLIYAQFESGLKETPYCIIVDHKWKSVVVAIRGTLSLEDCVVDVLLDPKPLDELGDRWGFDGTGEYCHSGVIHCVEWIQKDLERHGLLEYLLGHMHPSYTLRFTGHSLGAGCAAILSLMYRQTYPSLRCICISPPCGLMTWKSATCCKEFVTSFVLDSDMVPRLSVENMEHLRDEILELIARLKVPKFEVARSFFSDKFDDIQKDISNSNDEMLHPKDAIPHDSDFVLQLEEFEKVQRQRKIHRGIDPVHLYPCGQIIHLVKTEEIKSIKNSLLKCLSCGLSNAGCQYSPKWSTNDEFNEIIISPTMWSDHFPNRVCDVLETLASYFGTGTTSRS